MFVITATVPTIIYGTIFNKAGDWNGYVVMLIANAVFVGYAILITCIMLPKIKRLEIKQSEKNDFDISTLGNEVKNEFYVSHSQLVKAQFLPDKIVFNKVIISNIGKPMLKKSSQGKAQALIDIDDFYTEKVEVEYSEVKFYCVTHRECWKAEPGVGIAIRLPQHVVDELVDSSDKYVLIRVCKELLYYILGYGNKIVNDNLLAEKALTKKPKPVLKIKFAKFKWWAKLICMIGAVGVSAFVWILTNNIFLPIWLFVVIMIPIVLINPGVKFVIYDKYFSDGMRLCSISEITKILKYTNFSNQKRSTIKILTPAARLIMPFNQKVWEYLLKHYPSKLTGQD